MKAPIDRDHEHEIFAAMSEGAAAYAVELAHRLRTDEHVHVHEVRAKGAAPGMPGGKLLVVNGAADAPFMRAMDKAARSGDAHAVGKVLLEERRRLEAEVGKHRLTRVSDVGSRVAAVPVLTEVSYRGRSIASGLPVLKGFEATALSVPFAGGKLDPHGFVASHYRPRHIRAGLDVETYVIYRQPELTPLEKKILQALPEQDAAAVIGRGDLGANWLVATAIVVVVGVLVAGVYAGREVIREYRQREADRQREAQNAANDDGAGHQQAEQADQGQAQQADQGQQADQAQQQQQDQGQQQQQDQGQQDQGQADQQQQDDDGGNGDQQDKQDDGGSISRWIDDLENQAMLESLDARAAVQTLVEIRTGLVGAGLLH